MHSREIDSDQLFQQHRDPAVLVCDATGSLRDLDVFILKAIIHRKAGSDKKQLLHHHHAQGGSGSVQQREHTEPAHNA